MTVTTGPRVTMSSGFDSSVSTCVSSSSNVCIFTSAPNSRAIIDAVSVSSVLLMVIIIRLSINFFRTSFALTSSFSARSETVIPSASVIVRVTGGGGALLGTGACGRGSRRGPDERGPDGRGGGGR